MQTADYWIATLGLTKHVEGGAYAETYRSPLFLSKQHLPAGFGGDRPSSTAIYFLLQHNEFSAFHRIASDELWHFYSGGCLAIYEIAPNGQFTTHLLGNDPGKGESFQCLIRAGSWFASRPVNGDYVLAGCTVSPGFDFEDFELGERGSLTKLYPQHARIIQELTRS